MTENAQQKPVAAYCRICGAALAEDEVRLAQGTVFCAAHVPAAPQQTPASAPPPLPVNPGVSPGLAFILGLIPGVGAIYNGQYAKGIVHVLILGLLISIVSSDAAGGLEPLFGLLTSVFWFYMAFEAYHTARRRLMGEPVDEFSSLVELRGGGRSPLLPVLLIVFGALFLLNNFGMLPMREVLRYWPVLLIAAGVWMLTQQFSGGRRGKEAGPDVPGGGGQ
jgi:TM2 domain-containing membrane protein YozV